MESTARTKQDQAGLTKGGNIRNDAPALYHWLYKCVLNTLVAILFFNAQSPALISQFTMFREPHQVATQFFSAIMSSRVSSLILQLFRQFSGRKSGMFILACKHSNFSITLSYCPVCISSMTCLLNCAN